MLKKNRISKTEAYVTSLGFGAATLGNLYQPMSDGEAHSAIEKAFQLGINQIDTAPFYGFGLSERRVGDALRAYDASSYIISSKVGRLLKPCTMASEKYGYSSPMPFEPIFDYSYDGVMRSFEDSLQRLGLSEIDIIYMHDIGSLTHGDDHKNQFSVAIDSGYKAMRELRDQGVVKAIGLGVNEYQICEEAMNYASFDCFLLAGRYTLLEQKALTSFLPRCEKDNISIIIGGPYNSGILATGVSNAQQSTPYYNYEPAPAEVIDKVRKIEALCTEYKVTLAAAALQFPLAHSAVASVIPGLDSAKRVEQTHALMQEKIPKNFWLELKDQALLCADAPIARE